MTLYKRGNVFWSYVYVDGVRHQRSTHTANRRQAELIDQRHKEELNLQRQDLVQARPEMKLEDLVALFLADSDCKSWHVERLEVLLPFFKQTQIGRISKALVKQYRQQRHQQKKLTETTINRDLECLRHILYWAVDQGYLTANPLSRLRMERIRRRKRPVISIEDELRIIRAAAPHLKPIITCALDAGMRRGELLNQLWEDIDFNRRVIAVTASKTAEGESREIPMTQRVFDLLSPVRKGEGLVFTYQGNPVFSLKTAWKTALRKAKVRHYTFKTCRHTFNTRLMEAGVIQDVRKELCGHSRGGDTNDIYTHIELPILRKAIRKLEAWYAEQLREVSEEKTQETSTAQTYPEDANDHGQDGNRPHRKEANGPDTEKATDRSLSTGSAA